ncbi:MAG: ribonuclease P protein component [Oscillospiraceae bacterium]|nr:ribonuclease P protein component [Oscillospiraceae bacterium]
MSTKLETLGQNSLFARAYRSRLSFVSPVLVTYVLRKKRGGIRIGITASKKIGCAVQRNRARRIVKAAASKVLENADGSFDIVFVCRAATVEKKSTDLEPVLRRQLQKAGVLHD